MSEGKNAIGLKWVYRTKYNADGTIQKHKALLVAKEYAQQQVVDFDETFSPMARFETVRIFLALFAQFEWPVVQFDVKSTFLNGELNEAVFVSQPEGFVINGEENKVYKLLCTGLNKLHVRGITKLIPFFYGNGFKRSVNEPTLYFKKQGDNDFLAVCLYVDDMIYMGSCESLIDNFKSCMMKTFEMTVLGLLHYFLGLEVKQGADGIFISQ